MNDAQNELNAVFTAAFQRQEAEIQALRALVSALIATHPDHGALLERYLVNMDAIADSVSRDALPLYATHAQQFQNLILIYSNQKK